MTGRTDTSREGSNIELMFRTLVTPRMRHKMRAGYIVLGIQKAINMMAQEPFFCEASIALSFRGQRVGKITITRRLRAGAPTISATNDTKRPSLINNGPNYVNSSIVAFEKRTNPYNDPEMHDPHDRMFKITYDIQRDLMSKEEVSSAVLDAMVIIAKPGPLEVCDDLRANSVIGGARIWVTGFNNPSMPLIYGWVSKALNMIWIILMVRRDRWYEINFLLWYDEKPVGIGYFYNS